MGRQGGDPTAVISSSIALLQERFRQLQKVRENREKKELLKLLSESEHAAGTPYPRLSFQTDTDAGFQATTIPTSTCFWADGASTSRNQENSDVDTSLHL